MKTVKAHFETSDGHKWESKEKAEAHEACLQKLEAFGKAQSELLSAMGQDHSLADGSLLKLDFWNVLYCVGPGTFFFPEMQQLSFGDHSVKFRLEHDGEKFEFQLGLPRPNDDQRREDWYEFKHLYADKRKANEALLKAQSAFIDKLTARMMKTFNEVNSPNDDE